MDWDWQFTWDVVMPMMLNAAGTTVQATILAFILAVVLGLILMLLRTSPIKWIAWPVGEFIEFIRATPLLIQIFFLFFILPEIGITLPPLVTGILAIGIYVSALCSEVFRAGLQAVPVGQWEAAKALNLSTYRTYRGVIIPQLLPPVVPALGNYLIIIFKETPLLSFVAVAELMQAAKLVGMEYYRFTEAITMVGVFFLVMSLVAVAALKVIEHYVNRSVFH